jgi:hypothetical protein
MNVIDTANPSVSIIVVHSDATLSVIDRYAMRSVLDASNVSTTAMESVESLVLIV